MLAYIVLLALAGMLNGMAADWPLGADLHIDQNDAFLTCLRCLGSYDTILPIHDFLVPALLINLTLTYGLGSLRSSLLVVNIIRGSGAR